MTEEKALELWRLIEYLGWGSVPTFRGNNNNKNGSAEIVKSRFRALSKDTAKEVEDFASDMEGKLYDKILEHSNNNLCYYKCGDDTLHDTISHIVGLGKREFDRVMKFPDLFKKRIMKGDYMECFSYTFHSDD